MRAGRSSAPVPLPEAAARVPGRKPPRRSAERASRSQRDGPRFAHAVVAPRTRDIREKSAPVGAPPPPRWGMDANRKDEPRRTNAARERRNVRLRTNKTALCDVARWTAPPHPEEARRALSKHGRPRIDLRALMVRDAPCGAPHHEATELGTGARQASSCARSCPRSRLRPISTSLLVIGPSQGLSSSEKRPATR